MTSSITSGIVLGMAVNLKEGTVTEAKVKQNRIRRLAERQGLALQVSRRRDPRALDYGETWLYWLDSPNPDNSDDAWIGPFNSLDDVEFLLTTDDLDNLPPHFDYVRNIDGYLARHRG